MPHLILVHSKPNRFLHWFNMLSITLLTLTGFYIHNPLQFSFFPSMDIARKIHFIFMYLILYGVLIRIYYAIYTKDYRDILFRLRDIKGFFPLMRYYLFLDTKAPEQGKYNSGQKLVYNLWVIFIGVQGLTGFIMYFPTALADLGVRFGGMVVIRQVHYMVTWIFVYTVGIHIYMGIISGRDVLRSIITGYLPVSADETFRQSKEGARSNA